MSSRDPEKRRNVRTDETAVTDITIGPDGRLYIFGASTPVLEALEAAGLADEKLRRRLDRLRAVSQAKTQKTENPLDKLDAVTRSKHGEQPQ
jgi:hypothetical protein